MGITMSESGVRIQGYPDRGFISPELILIDLKILTTFHFQFNNIKIFQSGNFRIFEFQNAQRSADYCFEFGYFVLVHFELDFDHLSCMFQAGNIRATNHNQSP